MHTAALYHPAPVSEIHSIQYKAFASLVDNVLSAYVNTKCRLIMNRPLPAFTFPGSRLLKNCLLIVVTVLVTVWIVRAVGSRSFPDTSPWHEPALTLEFRARDYPQGISFDEYLQLEARLSKELSAFVASEIPDNQASLALRYMSASPLNPLEYTKNWNWSYILQHEAAAGAVVLIHGASDSPYSMRTLAQHLHQNGLNTVAVRLPGHGTVPGELTRITYSDWKAVVKSAIDKARQITGSGKPVYLVGYSMGGALAMSHALDTLENAELEPIAGLVLVSPAIAITRLAAFANVDLMISRIPGFNKFAWNSISPEYDPYKYNSFPKQTGRQTYRLATANQRRVNRLKNTKVWKKLPPIITFMSAVDATVSVPAVVDNLYESLTNEGSSLVLFGVNRTNEALGFLENDYMDSVNAVRTDANRQYDLTVISNRTANSLEVMATTYCAKNRCQREQALDLAWPESVFSLSHVALPFSADDPIYGSAPGPESPGNFTLGSLQPRGERGILVVPIDQLMRLRYNPFITYLLDRTSSFCKFEAALPNWSTIE